MKVYDIAIIGAGPAGIMAAIIAAETGQKVILIEKNPAIGRKILATGNGRCNLTNKFASPDRYHGADHNFIKDVLSKFDQHETMKFFEGLGLMLKEEDNGRIFPRTNQASSVVSSLEHRLTETGVEILLNSEVKRIENHDCWSITLSDGQVISSGKLILTTGGKAAHYLGSSGDGLFWVKNLGHTIKTVHAALVPIETKESWPKEVQGIKVEAQVSLKRDGQRISLKTGDLLFTHFGLSGPAIMAQARNAAANINESTITIHIDLFYDLEIKELDQKIAEIFSQSGKKTIKNALSGMIPQNLINVLLRLSNIDGDRKAAEISREKRLALLKNFKDLTLTILAIRPLKEAQVTAGGIDSTEIESKTLQSKIAKNLYFAGEIIDVDGDSGGFNLQWAWSSGYVAGQAATQK
ncbi:MAG: NAD(P)/FAD-dependent oxidoreductase [Patescibacteria group bacterium]